MAGWGLLSALALLATPFLPWIVVEPGAAARVGQAMIERARAERQRAGSDAFERLGQRLVERGSLTGLDVVQWSRGARERLASSDPLTAQPSSSEGAVRRQWTLLVVLLAGLTAGALVVVCYLAAHALARWRSSTLILAGLVGLAALGAAAALTWVERSGEGVVTAGSARWALTAGALGLLSAVLGSLTWHNVARVVGGLLLTALSLAGLAWAYLEGWA